jgi:hypothetical protein
MAVPASKSVEPGVSFVLLSLVVFVVVRAALALNWHLPRPIDSNFALGV